MNMTITPFKDDTTRICNLYNIRDNCYDRIEIATVDEETKTQIVMTKEVEREYK